MSSNLGFGNAGASNGKFVKLKDDGDTATFYVPEGSKITERWQVWEAGKGVDCAPGTEGAQVKYSVPVMQVIDGEHVAKTLEQSNSFWKKWKGSVEREGGTLTSHVWEVERIGERGSKSTSYRFRAVGPATGKVELNLKPVAEVMGIRAKSAAAK